MIEDLKEMGQALKERMRKIIPYLLTALFLISAGFAFYFWSEASALKEDPQKVAQDETRKLVTSVSKLIILPEGETPTIATVADPEKLRDQPFFARAQSGDKVLIYTNARKAILFSPTEHKIVEVAPINLGNPQTEPTQ